MSSSHGPGSEKLVEKIIQIREQLTDLHARWAAGQDPAGTLDEIERLACEGIESFSEGRLLLDRDLRIVSLNEAAEKLLGRNGPALIGRLFLEEFPDTEASFLSDQLHKSIAVHRPTNFISLLRTPPSPQWFELWVFPGETGVEMYLHLIRESEGDGEDSSEVVAGVARSTLRACKSTLGARRARLVLFTGSGGDSEVLSVNPTLLKEMGSLWLRAAGTRRPVMENERSSEPGKRARQNVLCVPLLLEDEVAGVLELSDKPRAFTEEDARVASAFADRIAVAVRRGAVLEEPARLPEISRTLFNSGDEAVYMYDFHNRFIDANRLAWEKLGYTREELFVLDARSIQSTRTARGMAGHLRSLRATGHAVCEVELVRHDGTLLPMELNSVLITHAGEPAVLSIARDIHRRKAIETLRVHSRRMEAVKDVARGFVEDIGTSMTALLGQMETLLLEAELPPAIAAELEALKKGARRIADMTLRLMSFGDRRSPQPRLLDLNALVCGMEQRVSRLLGDETTVRILADPAVGAVLADATLLEQVVIELSVISRDAMSGTGTLHVETRFVPAGDAPLQLHPEADFVDHAALILRESGEGIDEVTAQRIHEPFFTTATQEKKTPMGLATVHGIVKQLGGFIEAESAATSGATFRVFLPSFSSKAPVGQATLPAAALRARSARVVLLVEADESLRQREESVLRRCGFSVVQAPSAHEAFSALAPGLVVAVAVVPYSSHGGAAVKDLLRRFPGAGLVLVLAGGEEELALPFVHHPRMRLARKPLSMRELALKVWEMTEP